MEKNILLWEPLQGEKKSEQRLALLAGSAPFLPEKMQLRKNPQGKPYLEDSNLKISISHSGEDWLCILSERDVGIDIEKFRSCPYEKIVARFFLTDEQDAVLSRGRDMFFRIWAAKESYVKYTGEGLSALRTFSCIQNGEFCKEINGVPLLGGQWNRFYGFALAGGLPKTEVWRLDTPEGKLVCCGELQALLSTALPK
jgi:4'-phosphopantetheinyl transferase